MSPVLGFECHKVNIKNMLNLTGKVIKCRAAIAWAPNKPFVIETISVEPPRAHEVRIKMHATGVCFTDDYYLTGLNPQIVFPAILGQEGSGVVESVGGRVDKFKPGDHVVSSFVGQCGKCQVCKRGKSNICPKYFYEIQGRGVMADGTSRFSCRGKPLHHFMGTSTFTEYSVVSDVSLAKVNEKAALDRICLLGCGVSTGYGAALNTAKVEKGSSCAIWGLGGVGLACVMGCNHAKASRIIGIDIQPSKFEFAKKFGVKEFLNPNDYNKPIQDVLIEMTDGGLDYTFECAGNILAMQVALESTSPFSGVSVIVGSAAARSKLTTNPGQLIMGRTWKGSVFGGYKTDIIPVLVEDYLNGKIMLDEFITHRMELDEINNAFKLMRAGQCIRCIVKF